MGLSSFLEQYRPIDLPMRNPPTILSSAANITKSDLAV
jgi:hypothetical protein